MGVRIFLCVIEIAEKKEEEEEEPWEEPGFFFQEKVVFVIRLLLPLFFWERVVFMSLLFFFFFFATPCTYIHLEVCARLHAATAPNSSRPKKKESQKTTSGSTLITSPLAFIVPFIFFFH